jgi:hypothetical protein
VYPKYQPWVEAIERTLVPVHLETVKRFVAAVETGTAPRGVVAIIADAILRETQAARFAKITLRPTPAAETSATSAPAAEPPLQSPAPAVTQATGTRPSRSQPNP